MNKSNSKVKQVIYDMIREPLRTFLFVKNNCLQHKHYVNIFNENICLGFFYPSTFLQQVNDCKKSILN